MQVVQHNSHYLDNAQILDIHKKLDNGIQIKTNIHFLQEQFVDFQKDIIEWLIADISDIASDKNYDVDEIKTAFESGLQGVNTKLKAFASQMDKIEHFTTKWYIQVIVDNTLITSLIGDVTIMILRNGKLYYSLHNSFDTEEKIDLFSDFIEWDLENHDEILYVGTKVEDALDDNDLDTIQVAMQQERSVLETLEAILTKRMDKKHITFFTQYSIRWTTTRASAEGWSKYKLQMPQFSFSLGKLNKYKYLLVENKYYVSIAVLSVFVLFIVYHVLAQLLNVTQNDVMLTEAGVLVDVTIDDIKKDIQVFQTMDPTSDEKGQKYHEIMQKLTTLETRGRWLEDVKQLKNIIQVDYNKGFNIVYISSISQFDDLASNYKASFMTFNNAELNGLGTLRNLYFTNSAAIAGSKGALLGSLNDSVRGTLVDFGSDEDVINCSQNLMRNGLYCVTAGANLFNVTNGGLEVLATSDEKWFPNDVADIGVYGKANMYLLRSAFTEASTGAIFVTRYRNALGSQTQFEEGQDNPILSESVPAGAVFTSGFASYAIDGSFLSRGRNDAKLYQFWREGTSTLLSTRVVPLLGWDKASKKYSDDIKVIAYVGTRYVYLFDRKNQTFTVYDTAPNKDKDVYNREFAMRYLFSFTFALEADKVIDAAVPESLGNRPELYVLTSKGVSRIKLYEFIDSLAAGTLKQVTSN